MSVSLVTVLKRLLVSIAAGALVLVASWYVLVVTSSWYFNYKFPHDGQNGLAVLAVAVALSPCFAIVAFIGTSLIQSSSFRRKLRHIRRAKN